MQPFTSLIPFTKLAWSSAVLCLQLLVTTATPIFHQATPLKRHVRSTSVIEFFMPDSTHSSINWSQDPEVTQVSTNSQDVFGTDLNCPTVVSEGADVPLNKRSICPWYYKVDHELNRYPTTILKAMPLCQYCIGTNQTQECVAIQEQRTVLRQETTKDAQGNYKYIEETIPVSVGYTCAGLSTVSNAATQSTTTAASGSGGGGGGIDFAK